MVDKTKKIGLGLLIAAGAILIALGIKKKPEISVARRPPCGDMGDVDGDGWVTDNDAQMIAEYVVDMITLTPEQLIRADVNGDGMVDIVDAMFIAQYVEGIRDTFPVCGYQIESQVGAGSDDAHEALPESDNVITDNTTVIQASFPMAEVCYWGAYRWPISIPQGKTIKTAFASLYVENADVDDVNASLHFELAASPATFVAVPGSITSRARTIASAPWVADSLGVGWHDTPSLVAPLQELVNTYTVDAIALIVIPNLSDAWKYLFITSYDGNPTLAAKFYVEYV